MKLRFDRNSLRLRLKKSDLEKLRNENVITEIIPFPKGTFAYSLWIEKDQQEVSVMVEERSVKVMLPNGIALTWMNNNEVGIYHTMQVDENNNLDIIIEKDFPCKEAREEDPRDFFTPDDVAIPPNQC